MSEHVSFGWDQMQKAPGLQRPQPRSVPVPRDIIMVRARILCSRKYPTLLTQFSIIFTSLWEYYNSPVLPQNFNLAAKLNVIDKTHTLAHYYRFFDTNLSLIIPITSFSQNSFTDIEKLYILYLLWHHGENWPLISQCLYGNPNLSVNLIEKMQASIFYVPTWREIPRGNITKWPE